MYSLSKEELLPGLFPPTSVLGQSWPCQSQIRKRLSLHLTFGLPCGLIHPCGNQSAALMVHLLSCDLVTCPAILLVGLIRKDFPQPKLVFLGSASSFRIETT